MNLAIITARGGSKRIPRKNIRHFNGKPIIAYSIEAALASECFDEVMVSTEDEEIAKIAESYGAKVPFMRSAENANDLATTTNVLLEVLKEYDKRNIKPTLTCCIYPTAPFLTGDFLCTAFEILGSSEKIDVIMPITRFTFPIQRALRLIENEISMFSPEHIFTRSQDLEPAYHDAGQFYLFRTEKFLKTQNLLKGKIGGIILPSSRVQDIDTEDDWQLAEMKYRLLKDKYDAQQKSEVVELITA